MILTSGTLISYVEFRKTGALSLISDTRTISGILRLRLDNLIVHVTWNMIWLRFSSSRSNGFNNFNDFPFNKNIWLPFGKFNSNAISVNGSPYIGNSVGDVFCSITKPENGRKKKKKTSKRS